MAEFMQDYWVGLSATSQDIARLVALLLPAMLVGIAATRRYRPFGMIGAMIWRFRWTNALFVALIAVSVGLGVGLIAQERGLRQGSAHAAAKFDLIVSAPGSEIEMLLAAVFLQPTDAPLIEGETYDRIAHHDNVVLAAPLAYGDSYRAAPVIGTTAGFVEHLSGTLAQGRPFSAHGEAVIGARVDLKLGDSFVPAHGHGDGADHDAHAGHGYTVVGRMARSGSPWDRAILVPVEAVWEVHGLASGHAPGHEEDIGPPFDPAYFPGTPAVLVRATALWANYALHSEFTTERTMAFFPGAVLARLHSLLGDVRQAMSVMAMLTQLLVTAGVLTGLVIVTRLYARRLALMRALGAPARFVFAVVWGYAAILIGIGSAIGVTIGFAATRIISAIVTARTDIDVHASLDWPEFHLVAGFVSLTLLLALLPAFAALRRPVIADLRT
ncbi:MAG: ABC transporter permease [Nitratireductor sp.]|nr:ABC transporter permease [Nitratireductor sp.]